MNRLRLHKASIGIRIDSPEARTGSRAARCVWIFLLFAAMIPARAQFKEIGPPPFPPPVARQKFKTLLENLDAANRRQTIGTIAGWLPWYRDIFDEELIAAWKRDDRAKLPPLIKPLASARAAAGIVEFSWRQQREATFVPDNAAMFGDLMARYAESSKPFLDDLLAPSANLPVLSPPVAETVCRILVDMPDIGSWKQNASRILPRYRSAAQQVLNDDIRSGDEEKSYRAHMWLRELRLETAPSSPTTFSNRQAPRGTSRPVSPGGGYGPTIGAPPEPSEPPVIQRAPRPTLTAAPPPPAPVAPPPAPVLMAAAQPYNGANSGTLTCGSGTVPQNAEYVFRNLPPVKMQLDYDTKIWDARLAPGEGQTQKLILKNKSSGPQKRCVVHWSVIP